MTYALTTATSWPARIPGHDIRVRALSLDEVREARDEALRRHPPDLYGERLYLEIVATHTERLRELFATTQEAAAVADAMLGRVAAGEDVSDEAARAVDALRLAHGLLEREARMGRLRAFAARKADPVDREALERFEAHLAAPHVELAVRGVTHWGGRPVTPEQVRDCLDTLEGDTSGAAGHALAMDITTAMSGGALDDRGKGQSARRGSSPARVNTASASGRKAAGTANGAKRRRGSAR